jgi:hypothetical protein
MVSELTYEKKKYQNEETKEEETQICTQTGKPTVSNQHSIDELNSNLMIMIECVLDNL